MSSDDVEVRCRESNLVGRCHRMTMKGAEKISTLVHVIVCRESIVPRKQVFWYMSSDDEKIRSRESKRFGIVYMSLDACNG